MKTIAIAVLVVVPFLLCGCPPQKTPATPNEARRKPQPPDVFTWRFCNPLDQAKG